MSSPANGEELVTRRLWEGGLLLAIAGILLLSVRSVPVLGVLGALVAALGLRQLWRARQLARLRRETASLTLSHPQGAPSLFEPQRFEVRLEPHRPVRIAEAMLTVELLSDRDGHGSWRLPLPMEYRGEVHAPVVASVELDLEVPNVAELVGAPHLRVEARASVRLVDAGTLETLETLPVLAALPSAVRERSSAWTEALPEPGPGPFKAHFDREAFEAGGVVSGQLELCWPQLEAETLYITCAADLGTGGATREDLLEMGTPIMVPGTIRQPFSIRFEFPLPATGPTTYRGKAGVVEWFIQLRPEPDRHGAPYRIPFRVVPSTLEARHARVEHG